MIDTVRSLLGPRYCDWCTYRDDSWWERKANGRGPLAYFAQRSLRLGTALGIWKLGARWHFARHPPRQRCGSGPRGTL